MFANLRRLNLGWVIVLTMAAGIAHAGIFMRAKPANLDFSLSKPTDKGLFVGAVQSGVLPIPMRKIHSWTISLKARDGMPVEGATIKVNGGMPQHGHGLPSKPQVTRSLGDGRYLIEGMKFNMGGWWTVKFDITGPAGADTVTFNLDL